MPIFQYQEIKTPVHRLNALTKFSLLVVASLMSSFLLDPRYKIPLIALVFIYAYLAKLPLREYRGLLILVSASLLLARMYSVFFIVDENLFKVYDQSWAGTIIFRLWDESLPVLGSFFGEAALTYGGVIWLLTGALTGISVVTMLATHVHTTSLNETVQALSTLKAPFPVIYITMVALRFTPELASHFTLVQRAQTLRGWRVNTRNPIKIIRLYAPLLFPVVRHVIKSIDITTMSTQNRAFGLGPVTNMSEGLIETRDKVLLICTWIFFVVMMVLILRFNVGNL